MDRYRRYVRQHAPGALREIVLNRLRGMFGRTVRPSRNARLFASNAAHLLRLRPIRKLTVTDYLDGEGAGSKALMTMFAIAFCRRFGLEYVHTPFSGLRHTDRPQAQFDAAWEAFFNLGQGEVAAAKCRGEAFDLFLLSHMKLPDGADLTSFIQPPLPGPRPVYYVEALGMGQEHMREEHSRQFRDILAPCLADFRQRFWTNKQRQKGAGLQVAVHLRRGDVGPERQDMWTSTAAVHQTLAAISEEFARQGASATFTVFSQGEREGFAELEQFNPVWVLDGDPMAAMQQMIEADVLVTAKSCFSYVAALLSDAIVLSENSAWPCLDDWIERDADGRFDRAVLADKLAALTSRRP